MNKRDVIIRKIVLACMIVMLTWRGIDQFPTLHKYVEQHKVTVGTVAYIRTSSKDVALVIDVDDIDAPVKDVVDLLDREDVKATFLLNRDWASQYPLTLQEIEKRGYEARVYEKLHGWSFNLEQLLQENGTVDPTPLRERMKSGWVLRLPVKQSSIPILPIAIQVAREKGMAICTLHQLESEQK
ncbi:hypothetical protein DNHGIG_34000 [Collibacillus ludicampi]|uniref:NodB homology domain-containing protein n=1 Tax=Collibacillus ludicampi TaxID=2771369 RepID=A0AAV4LJA7_9BACL|nr:polysaccharide deacetylase family protein [Collibacillus ludicampi]GIM47851.1 hypothetical protein DNHGIG_34000 [Collibacillus ludicampi]